MARSDDATTVLRELAQIGVEFPVGTRYEVTEDALLQLAEIARNEINGYQDIIIQYMVGLRTFMI